VQKGNARDVQKEMTAQKPWHRTKLKAQEYKQMTAEAALLAARPRWWWLALDRHDGNVETLH